MTLTRGASEKIKTLFVLTMLYMCSKRLPYSKAVNVAGLVT